jgi:hypothetical protein
MTTAPKEKHRRRTSTVKLLRTLFLPRHGETMSPSTPLLSPVVANQIIIQEVKVRGTKKKLLCSLQNPLSLSRKLGLATKSAV